MPQRAGRCLAGTKGLAMRYAGWVVLALLAGVPVARAHDAPPRPHAPAITAPVPAAPNPESPAAITIRDGVLTGPMGPDPHGTPAATVIDHLTITPGAKGLLVSGKGAVTTLPGGGLAGRDQPRLAIDHSTIEPGGAALPAVMITSAIAGSTEVGTLSITDSTISAKGPALLVAGANAAITISGGALASDAGILLLVRANDAAAHAPADGPGVRLTIKGARLTGDIDNADTDRPAHVTLTDASLTGALHHVSLSMDAASHWAARANSEIALMAGTAVAAIDAPAGVTITARVSADGSPHGTYPLTGGGTLIITE